MAKRGVPSSLTPGHVVDLLCNGEAFFPALCASIDAAKQSIYLETYIYADDDTGTQVRDALMRAAQRGVTVRVVVDGFGSAPTAAWLKQALAQAGGECLVFRPEYGWRRFLSPDRRRLRRLHRKLVVIDEAVAYVGGINIVGDFTDTNGGMPLDAPRFDFAVRVSGPLVQQVLRTQWRLWARLKWDQARAAPRRLLEAFGPAPRLKPSQQPHPEGVPAALVTRDNLRNRQSIEQVYSRAIAAARHEVLIANAYFLPGRRFRKALRQAARRGVRVRLLLQGRVEYRLQHYASQALYTQLLRDGVEIWEYTPSFHHAKVAVVDDYATVGSSNLDPFSLLLAREANVVVHDAAFAGQLRTALEQAIAQGGRKVDADDHGRQAWPVRWMHRMAYSLLRLGVALVGESERY